MSEIHQLILAHGRDEAIRRVSATERPLVDIAANILDEESKVAAPTGRPHRNPHDAALAKPL